MSQSFSVTGTEEERRGGEDEFCAHLGEGQGADGILKIGRTSVLAGDPAPEGSRLLYSW